MSLRELLLFGTLAVLVFVVPRRPIFGAYAWVVFGIMNPHRLAWGAAYDFPFAQYIAILTLIGLLLTKEHRHLKGGAPLAVLLVFFAWCTLTTLFPLQPQNAQHYWTVVLKNLLMTTVLLTLIHTRAQIITLVSLVAFSLAFYGVKGGLFVIRTAGNYFVVGPPDSVMQGNNSLGVGLSVVLPLLYFLLQQSRQRWLRIALSGAMILCAIAILGSYSRGAMLAIAAAGAFLWFRGKHKLRILVGILMFALVAIPAMPEHWVGKMNTLQTYEEDGSAMGRLIAWETAYNIAVDKFPLGGGFEWDGANTSMQYSPVKTVVLVPHSIYFQVIGSQGFIGLGIFLLFWFLVWRQCGWLMRMGHSHPELAWAHSLGSMMQVALVGYFVGGAFLDLAFWELAYYLFAIVATAKYVVSQTIAIPSAPAVIGTGVPPGEREHAQLRPQKAQVPPDPRRPAQFGPPGDR